MAKRHQKAAVAAKVMAARTKAMAAHAGAKAKVTSAEEKEFTV